MKTSLSVNGSVLREDRTPDPGSSPGWSDRFFCRYWRSRSRTPYIRSK